MKPLLIQLVQPVLACRLAKCASLAAVVTPAASSRICIAAHRKASFRSLIS
jgi:hypothetical protein